MPKLTAAAVDKFAPGRKRREIRDDPTPGLYLVIQALTEPREPPPKKDGKKGKRRGRRKGGGKSWAMRFRRPDGRPGKLVLGKVDLSGEEMPDEPVIGGPLTLAGARQIATAVNRARAAGRDVIAEYLGEKQRRQIVKKEAAANAFAAAARDFVEQHVWRKTRRWRETARQIGFIYPREVPNFDPDAKTEQKLPEPTLAPDGLATRWRSKSVREIDGHDIHTAVDEARRIGVPGVPARNEGLSEARARALFAALSSCFGWLLRHRRVDYNPCAGAFRPGPPRSRERVLTASEIRLFWLATDHVDAPRPQHDADGNERELPRPFRPALRLLLLTGQRLREVSGMRADELPENDTWRMSGSRTKNKRPHVVPLSALAREQIEAGRKTSRPGKAGLIFTTTGETPLSGWSKCKARLDEKMLEIAREEAKAAGRAPEDVSIPPWRLHDLRRTCVTNLAELGIPPDVIELAVNHVSGMRGGIAGTYNRSELLPERRAALERWASHVSGIVSGKKNNVVQMRRGKK
jgi:integrase